MLAPEYATMGPKPFCSLISVPEKKISIYFKILICSSNGFTNLVFTNSDFFIKFAACFDILKTDWEYKDAKKCQNTHSSLSKKPKCIAEKHTIQDLGKQDSWKHLNIEKEERRERLTPTVRTASFSKRSAINLKYLRNFEIFWKIV